MDSGSIFQIIILIILLLLSAFFSSAETALTTVNRIRMRSLAEDGNSRAACVLKVTDDSGKMLSAILIGNNIVNLSASSIATSLALDLWGSVGAGIATGILTLLILIFGEISPKTIAAINAEKISLSYCNIIYWLMKLLTPVIFILNKLSIAFLFLLRVDPNAKDKAMTEEELRTIVDVGKETGVIESEEHEMINNVFDFGDAQAKEVMVPRIDMTFANIDCTNDELIEIFKEDKFTRLPVYKDTTDNVIGIINMKDLLLYDSTKPFNIRDYLRKPHFTYEYKDISELLVEMRDSTFNIAIVLDEYGEMTGLITLEDILEEIVGEIHDEYDESENELIKKLSDREYIVEGSMSLDDVNDHLGTHLDSEDYDSLGGLIIEHLDRLPVAGDQVITDDHIRLVVEKLDKNRIESVRVILPEATEETESGDSESSKEA